MASSGGAGRRRDGSPRPGSPGRPRSAARAREDTRTRPPRRRAPARGRRLGELRVAVQRRGLLLGLLEVVAAGHEHDHLRRGVGDLVPRHLTRRAAPSRQEVASRRRPRPCRAPSGRRRTAGRSTRAQRPDRRQPEARPPHRVDPLAQPVGELPAAARPSRSPRPTTSMRLDHVVEGVAGRATAPSRRRPRSSSASCTWPRRHRADPAQVLRQDQVGLDALDQVAVEQVDRLAAVHALADGASISAARQRPVLGQCGVGHDGLRPGLRRVVALERSRPSSESPSPSA